MVTAWQQERRRKQAQQLKSESVAGLEALLGGIGGIADEQQRQTKEAQAAEERKRKAAMDEAEAARKSEQGAARLETEKSRAAANVLREKRLATETEAQNAERNARAGVLRQKADVAEAERKRNEAVTSMSRRMDALTSRADVEKAAAEAGMAPDEFLAAVGEVDQKRINEDAAKASKLDLEEARTDQAKAAAEKAARIPAPKPQKAAKPAPSPAAVGQKQAKDAMALRKEFSGRPEVKTAVESGAAFRKMQAAAGGGAAGDLALIFAFMKVMDPSSTVRESEFANAENAKGVPEWLQAKWNKAKSGERLTGEQRAEFVKQAKIIADAYKTDADAVRSQYRGIAERSGLNPIDVVGEDAPAPQAAAPAAPVVVPDNTPAVAPAGVRVLFEGKVVTVSREDLPAALADGAKVIK
jgi:hypothetical protein